MMARTQITLDPELLRGAVAKSAALGISLAEYLRRLVERDLESPRPAADVRAVFDLGRSGGGDVAGEKDRWLGEAVDDTPRRRVRSGTRTAARRKRR